MREYDKDIFFCYTKSIYLVTQRLLSNFTPKPQTKHKLLTIFFCKHNSGLSLAMKIASENIEMSLWKRQNNNPKVTEDKTAYMS